MTGKKSQSTALLLRVISIISACFLWVNAAAAAPVDNTVFKPCPATAARIILLHSGKVSLNGVEIELPMFPKAFGAIQPRPTEACYSQERPEDRSRDLGDYIEGLIFTRMPFSIYTDGTFIHRIQRFPQDDS